MARARNIKPGFFKNELLVEHAAFVRLLFVGLWTLADREGRVEDRPKRIKLELFPYDSEDVDASLKCLATSGFIERYTAKEIAVIQIVNFLRHQTPHGTEKDSLLPDRDGLMTTHERDSRGYVNGSKRAFNVNLQANNVSAQEGNVSAEVLNSATPVRHQGNNALNPESRILNPDSLNPDLLIPDLSVPKGTADKSARPALSTDEIIFGYGLPLLTNAGTPDKQARSFLGGLRKQHGDEVLVNSLRDCIKAKPLQPLEWLAAALPPKGTLKRNKQEQVEDENRAIVRRLLEKEAADAAI